MGYDTTFEGAFRLDRALDDKTYQLLLGLAMTRRVKRASRKSDGYGIDGEFYIPMDVGDQDVGGHDICPIVDEGAPPRPQPGFWLHWTPTEDRLAIIWDGDPSFPAYIPWIRYISDRVLKPAGYTLAGTVICRTTLAYSEYPKLAWLGTIAVGPEGIKTSLDNNVRGYGDRDPLVPSSYCWPHGSNNAFKCEDCRRVRDTHQLNRKLDEYYQGLTDDMPKL